MGGQEGNRGYLYQGLACIFSALLDESWRYISVEYHTDNDKVDIALLSEEELVIKAIQVKSSANLFTKSNIATWLKDLFDDVESQEYCLTLIGNLNDGASKFINSIRKYYNSKMDKQSEASLKGFKELLSENIITVEQLFFDEKLLFSVVSNSIHKFIYSKTKCEVSFPELEKISFALLSLNMLLGTKGEKVNRTEYEKKNHRLV